MKKRLDDKDIENIREKIFPSLLENSEREETPGRRFSEKQDKRAIARQYRKAGKLVSLVDDLSSDIEYMTGVSSEIEKLLAGAFSGLEKLKTGITETVRFYSDISGPAENIRNAVSETSYSVSDLQKSISKFKRTISDITSEFENIIVPESGSVHTGELHKHFTELALISSKIAAIADKIDIIGINSSLEAGKTGNSGAFFSLMGSTLQKSVRAVEWKSKEFDSEISGFPGSFNLSVESQANQVEIDSDIKHKLNELSERLGDISDSLLVFNGILEEISGKIDFAVSESLKFRFSDSVNKKTDEIFQPVVSAQENASSLHKLVVMASEIETRLSVLPGKILPEQQNESIIDCICDTSDELSLVFEKTMNGLEEIAHEIDNASRLGSSFEKETASIYENSGTVVSTIGESIEKTEEARSACDELFNSINKTSSELGGLIDSLRKFKKNSDAVIATLEKIYSILESLSILIFHLETLAGKMEIFALISQTEILRFGDVKTGFTNIPVELGNVTRNLYDLSAEISGFRQKIKTSLMSLPRRDKYGIIDNLIYRAETIRDSVLEVSSMDYSPAENVLLLLKLLDELKKTQGVVSEKTGENAAQVHAVSQNIEQSFGFAANIKKTLENSLSNLSEINSTAMEFYPDEK